MPPRKSRDRTARRPSLFSREIKILYEDDAVVAVDKPAGLPATPIKGSDATSAWAILGAEMKRRKPRAFWVHRIGG